MMEKNRLHDSEPIPHDRLFFTPEQLALEALIDELFTRSDLRAFDIMNKICEEIEHE